MYIPDKLPRGRRKLAGGREKALVLAFCVLAWVVLSMSLAAPEAVASPPGLERSSELGLPFVRHFTPREYGQAGQNWTLVQDEDGLVYAGNNHGVLQYDGSRWRLIPLENRSVVRSLMRASDGAIYVGGQRELGFLAPDELGRLTYHSLMQKVPDEIRDFMDVWEVVELSDGIYFSTFQRLLRFDGERFDWWEPVGSFHRAFNVRGEMYIRDRGAGLVRVGDDGPVVVPGGEQFIDHRVDVMLPWPGPAAGERAEQSGEILVGTRDLGLLIFDGDNWRRFETEIDHLWASEQLYDGVWMLDGRLAMASTQSGVYFVNPDGSVAGQLNRTAGMEDEIVYFLMLDHQGGLWMALDGGIARAGGDIALTRFDSRRGLPGRVNVLHRHAGRLYAGTNHALFKLDNDTMPAFQSVEGARNQTWALVSVGDELLAANNDGVHLINGTDSEMIRPSVLTSFSLLASSHFPGRVYVGLSNGLAVIKRTEAGWQDYGRVADVSEQIRTMYELDDGRLWLGTAHGGVIRLEMPAELGSTDVGRELVSVRQEQFVTEHGLPDLARNFVYDIGGEPVFSTSRGLMSFHEDSRTFELDPRFDILFQDATRRLTALAQDKAGRIWMHARDVESGRQETGFAVPDGSGGYIWETRALQKLRGIYTYSILADDDGIVWMGGDEGLFRFNRQHALPVDWSFAALIRQVEVEGGRLLYGGSGVQAPVALHYDDNRLRFEFAAPSFIPRETLQYQTLLKGQDEDWSDWRPEATERRANLWEGEYQLRVRARDALGQLSDEAVFSFEVLPPWYRTVWAYVAYFAGFLLLAVVALNLYYWRLAAKNRELQLQVRARTRDLEQAKNRAEQALEQLQATQAELVEAEKMATVGRLVAGMAHEINTPVSNGRMTATRLMADRSEVEDRFRGEAPLTRSTLEGFLDECRQGLELMSASFGRIGTLVSRLHRIAGEPDSEGTESFDLVELVEDLARIRQDDAVGCGVAIRLDLPEKVGMTGNRHVLQECLDELISNSLTHGFPASEDASADDGEIRFRIRQANEQVVIEYSDNGVGLSPDVEKRVFEPFAGGMQSDARHPGLGMHMLLQMVKRVLGGEIENQPVEQGVDFVIRLPLQARRTGDSS